VTVRLLRGVEISLRLLTVDMKRAKKLKGDTNFLYIDFSVILHGEAQRLASCGFMDKKIKFIMYVRPIVT